MYIIMIKKEYIMKYLFTLIFSFFATLSVSLYSAQRPPNNPSDIYNFSGYDLRVDWRSLFRDRSQLNAILKNIPLSIRNKPRIYTECSVFINSLGLETIIDALIDYAAINDPTDLDLFCQYTGIQLSESQMQAYNERLMTLNDFEKQMFNAIKHDNFHIMVNSLAAGARVNAQNELNNTALMLATAYDRIASCARWLLQDLIIDVNAQNQLSNTALTNSVVRGKPNSIQLLLQHPEIDVNIQEDNGQTALILAVTDNYSEGVRLLLQHKKINLSIADNQGKTALMYAQESGYQECEKLLLKHLYDKGVSL